MRQKRSVKVGGMSLPKLANRALGVLGVGSIIYGLIRYTFIGEVFERAYERAVGHSPIDDLADSLDPREDLTVMKADSKSLKNTLD